MRPPGLAAFASRRPERSGIYTYEQGELAFPPSYAARLAERRRGRLPSGRRPPPRTARSPSTGCMTAKQEATRDKRMAQLVDDSAAGRLIPSQRYGEAPRWVERAAAAAAASGGRGS